MIALLAAEPTREVTAALARFLEVDDERPGTLRQRASRVLAEHGDDRGAPLIAGEIVDAGSDHGWTIPVAAAASVAGALVDAALIGGPDACGEKRMTAACKAVRGGVAMRGSTRACSTAPRRARHARPPRSTSSATAAATGSSASRRCSRGACGAAWS